MATFAAFGGRDSGVPMLLGAAAFAALESDVFHHTLPAGPEVGFAWDLLYRRGLPAEPRGVTLGLNRPLCRCSPFHFADPSCNSWSSFAVPGARREVQRIPQALQFPIIVKRTGP